jgi:hypothetical protein
MIPIGKRRDGTNDHVQEIEGSQAFPDELIDQLLAQVQDKDAKPVLSAFRLAGQFRSDWPSACSLPN